ncbi:MAG: hypothetical protein AAF491_01075 [Verrucomicrobiota bacterium]
MIDSLRGTGLMLGFVLDVDAVKRCAGFSDSGKTPSLFVVSAVMEKGMLTVPAGEEVVRWLPRLDVPGEEVDEALSLFKAVLDTLAVTIGN